MDQVLLDEFCVACGLNDPYRVEVSLKGDAATRTYEFRRPFLVVGRRADCDLFLDHWLVSRRHAYLQLVEGRFCCVDLGSRTGTHGGDATERTGWLAPGRQIQVGPYSVRPNLPAEPDPEYPPLPIVTWSLAGQEGTSPRWSMNRGLILVGRSPSCRIRLPDAGVSRFHCGLVLTADGVWVVDLLSQKSLLVNDEAVRFAPVRPGDRLQVGPAVLTPHYDMSLVQAAQGRGAAAKAAPPRFRSPGGADAPRPAATDSASDDYGASLPALTPTVLGPDEVWSASPATFVGADLERLGSFDPTLVVVIQQLGAMMQQMQDQNHRSQMEMFERFASLHQESYSSLRAEFDEFRKLTDEIDTLRAETARLAEATTLSMQQSAFDRSSQHQAPPGANGAPRPTALPFPASAAAPTAARVTPPLPDPHADIHAQLCQRLGRIEAERQSRWQKIMAMMTAKP